MQVLKHKPAAAREPGAAPPQQVSAPEEPRRTVRAVRAVEVGPLAEVAKGLATSDLPQSAKHMLEDMLETSLGVFKEQRDTYQSEVVDMVGGVLSSVEARMRRDLEEQEAAISEGTRTREQGLSEATAKNEEIEAKRTDVLQKKRELAEVARAFKTARVAAADAKARCRSAELEAKALQKQRDRLAGVLAELKQPMVEEGAVAPQDGPAPQEKVELFIGRLSGLELSDSMMAALPNVLVKAPSDRVPFDDMVLGAVEKELQGRIATADQGIQDAGPTKAADEEALQEAEAALEEVAVRQVEGAAVYTKVRGEEEELEKEAAELQQTCRNMREVARKHNAQSSRARAALDAFLGGPKRAFEELQLREAAVAEVAASAGEAKPAEGAAAAAVGSAEPEPPTGALPEGVETEAGSCKGTAAATS